jgi:hypothetical protein
MLCTHAEPKEASNTLKKGWTPETTLSGKSGRPTGDGANSLSVYRYTEAFAVSDLKPCDSPATAAHATRGIGNPPLLKDTNFSSSQEEETFTMEFYGRLFGLLNK